MSNGVEWEQQTVVKYKAHYEPKYFDKEESYKFEFSVFLNSKSTLNFSRTKNCFNTKSYFKSSLFPNLSIVSSWRFCFGIN